MFAARFTLRLAQTTLTSVALIAFTLVNAHAFTVHTICTMGHTLSVYIHIIAVVTITNIRLRTESIRAVTAHWTTITTLHFIAFMAFTLVRSDAVTIPAVVAGRHANAVFFDVSGTACGDLLVFHFYLWERKFKLLLIVFVTGTDIHSLHSKSLPLIPPRMHNKSFSSRDRRIWHSVQHVEQVPCARLKM